LGCNVMYWSRAVCAVIASYVGIPCISTYPAGDGELFRALVCISDWVMYWWSLGCGSRSSVCALPPRAGSRVCCGCWFVLGWLWFVSVGGVDVW